MGKRFVVVTLTRWTLRLVACCCATIALAAFLSWTSQTRSTEQTEPLAELFARTTGHLRARELLLGRNTSRLVFVTASRVRLLPRSARVSQPLRSFELPQQQDPLILSFNASAGDTAACMRTRSVCRRVGALSRLVSGA